MAEAALVQERYALETRAETLKLASADEAVRRGESDRFEIGSRISSDAVEGAESFAVGGDLVERFRSRTADALRLQTDLRGGLELRSASDMTLLGGAMAETHGGPVLLAAGMSDDVAAGGGIRVAAAGDLRLAGLVGVEDRIGSAEAEQVLVEAFATHFEREYHSGAYMAGCACFTGAVAVTACNGFRPLYKVTRGVRNLTAGAGRAAAASPPAPNDRAELLTGLPAATRTYGLADMAMKGKKFSDILRFSQLVDNAHDSHRAGSAGRAADTAQRLAELKRLTLADADESLAAVRSRAKLPSDAGMSEAIDFLRRANRGQVGDGGLQRASLALREDLAAAKRPFLRPLLARGVPAADLEALPLAELRRLFGQQLQQARSSGADDAADLQTAFLGFDTVVYRNIAAFAERSTADGAAAQLAPEAAAALVQRLVDLRLDWAEQPGETGLVELAIDEAHRGHDPMPLLDRHLRQMIWHGGEATSPGELDALQEAVATIRLAVHEVLDGGATAADDTVEPTEMVEVDALQRHGWTALGAGSAGVSTAERLRCLSDADVRGLDDFSCEEDAQADVAAAGGERRIPSQADSEAILPLADYPLLPPRLPADVDAGELTRSLRGFRSTLIDPNAGLPPHGVGHIRAKRRGVTDALNAVRRGQDPVAALDERIRAVKRQIDGEAAPLRDVRYVVDQLLEQHRSARRPRVATVDDAAQIDVLRGSPAATPTPTRLDFVARPAIHPFGLGADVDLGARDFGYVAGLVAAADIAPGDLEAMGGAYATVAQGRRRGPPRAVRQAATIEHDEPLGPVRLLAGGGMRDGSSVTVLGTRAFRPHAGETPALPGTTWP